jgi:integrase
MNHKPTHQPTNLWVRALKLSLPVGEKFVSVTVSPQMSAVRLSIGTSDPSEVKARTARLDEHLEQVWARLREDRPAGLSQRQAVALAGDLYRAWAGGEGRERTRGVVRIPVGEVADGESAREWQWQPDNDPMDDEAGLWANVQERLAQVAQQDAAHSAKDDPEDRKRPLEAVYGAIIDGLLSRRAIFRTEPASRELLLKAFHAAMLDAAASRERNAAGDYAPDPKAGRFPEWEDSKSTAPAPPAPSRRAKVPLSVLLEGWWAEAKADNGAVSTYESYSRTVRQLSEFLGHDDASRITEDDIIAFKDNRIAQGKSPKTVRDSDLAALRSLFGWAVDNRRLSANSAKGVKLRRGKKVSTRGKDFTPEEAKAILRHALAYSPGGREAAKTSAAKRWTPWLCAYTGARVGEIVQLRRKDVRQEGSAWVIRITPEAGTQKTGEWRDVLLHAHLTELGFAAFVERSKGEYLFLNVKSGGDVRGPWRTIKNRVAAFARQAVTDKRVAPNHGWRHMFKTKLRLAERCGVKTHHAACNLAGWRTLKPIADHGELNSRQYV